MSFLLLIYFFALKNIFKVLNSAEISLHKFCEILTVRPEIVVSSIGVNLRRTLVTETQNYIIFDNLKTIASS